MATDSTQFLIEMAAKLTGADASVASLTDLGDKMLKAGASAAELESVVAKMSTALEESAASVQSANDAVSEGQKNYDQMETAADRAAKAVERLNAQVEEQRAKFQAAADAGNDKAAEKAAAKLQELDARQSEAIEKAFQASAALKAEASALDALKSKASAAESSQEALKKGLANVKSAAKDAAEAEAKASGSGKVNEAAEALGRLGGPLGVAGQRVFALAGGFDKLVKSMGTAGLYGAIAVAIVAIATAAAAATIAITKWGVSLADANRTQGLVYDGIARTREGGAQLADTIDRLGTIVPMTNDELTQMASQLANTGLRGKDLTNALERSAVAASKLKFGPDFQAAFLNLDFQAKKFHDNIASTFGGLKIDPLLEGIQTLGALFDSGTASGRALKFLFETLFQPLVDGAAEAIPKIERLFLYAEILALKAYIALKPYRAEIKLLAEGFAIAAAIVGGVLVAGIVALVASVAAVIVGPIALVGVLIAAIIKLGQVIANVFSGARDWLAGAGTAMIEGFIGGIKDGAAKVEQALVDTVSGGIKAVENFLKTGSPSKLTYDLGGDTTDGFAGGVEDGTANTQDAMEAMVALPKTPAGAGAGGQTMGDVYLTIQIDGRGENDESLAQKIADKVLAIFEGNSLMIGGGEAPAT